MTDELTTGSSVLIDGLSYEINRAPGDNEPHHLTPAATGSTLPGHEDRTNCWCEPTVGWPGHPLGLVHRDPARADTEHLVTRTSQTERDADTAALDDRTGKSWREVSRRLMAAGDDETCCELACYEDPGCACDGCQPARPDTAALVEALTWIAEKADGFCVSDCENGVEVNEETGETRPCLDSIHLISKKARAALEATDD